MLNLKEKLILAKDSYTNYRYEHVEQIRVIAEENYQVEVFTLVNKVNELRDYLFDYFSNETKKIEDFKVEVSKEYIQITDRYYLDVSVYSYNKEISDVRFSDKWIILSDKIRNSLRDVDSQRVTSLGESFVYSDKPLIVSLSNDNFADEIIDNLLNKELAANLKHLMLDFNLKDNQNTPKKKNKV